MSDALPILTQRRIEAAFAKGVYDEMKAELGEATGEAHPGQRGDQAGEADRGGDGASRRRTASQASTHSAPSSRAGPPRTRCASRW